MPGFFDFNPNSPMAGSDSPSWMGSILGQEPAVQNPIGTGDGGSMLGATSVPQSNTGNIPYDAIASMQGINMPQVPTMDSLGRYGITDDQRNSAGNKALSGVLMGAAQSFMGGGANPALQAGMAAGGVRDQYLNQYSANNINNFKLQVEAKAKELDFISKKSDISKQQMVIEQEKLKLDALEQTKAIATEFGKQMEPVVAETLAKAQQMYPEKVDTLKRGFLTAQGYLAAGELAKADAQYELTIKDLPDEWQKDLEESVFKKTAEAAAQFGIGMETISNMQNDPNFKALGLTAEMGPNGMPVVVTKRELEERRLKDQLAQAQADNLFASAEEARGRANYYNNGGSGGQKGKLTEAAIAKNLAAIETAIEMMDSKPPSDPKQFAAWQKDQAKNKGTLAVYGLTDPQAIAQWRSLDPMRKRAAVEKSVPPEQPSGPVPTSGPSGGLDSKGALMQVGVLSREPNATLRDTAQALAQLSTLTKDPRAKAAIATALQRFSQEGGNDKNVLLGYVKTYLGQASTGQQIAK